jgi:hypothetical protein
MKKLILLCTLMFASCALDPRIEQVSVSGDVTRGGQPVVNQRARLEIGVLVRPVPSIRFEEVLNGTYRIDTGVDANDCVLLYLEVTLLDASGAAEGVRNEPLGDCGAHIIDLDFDP